MTEHFWCATCGQHRVPFKDDTCPICDDNEAKAREEQRKAAGWA